MNKEYAIKFENVSKIFNLKADKNKEQKSFYALKDVSFEIPKGSVVGVLGTNGSGKSTLSVILSGISEPSEGKMTVVGEQALIAINIGLNNQLTGYENIELKGALMGLSKKNIASIVEEVIDFAEIGDFLYQPVKKYSSGMRSRLGFAINLALDPEILIIDEALSVGDKGFANKCLGKMNELKEQGKTIVFISHALPQVKEFCDTGLWIEAGELKAFGDVEAVCDEYSQFVDELNKMSAEDKKVFNAERFESRVLEKKKQKRSLFNLFKK